MKKLFKIISVVWALLLASCGGGGGFSGTPNGPSAELRVFPPVSAVTVPVGYSYATVEIQGGRPPYVVMSSTGAIRASVVNGNRLQLAGMQAGTSEVAVVDQERAMVKIQVTAELVPMKSTVGSAVSLRPQQAISFDIIGGVGPYTVRSQDTSVATVTPAQALSGPFVINALKQGATTITVTDTTNTDLDITVTVVSDPIVVTPAAGTGKAGTSIVLNVSGGRAPYSVLTVDPTIAEGSLSGNILTVALKKKGATKLVISDAQGVVQQVDITVNESSLQVVPASVQVFTAAPVTFQIAGGVPPFIAVASQPSAVSDIAISSDNTKMTVTPVIPGMCFADISVTISVFDQTGSSQNAVLKISQDPAAVCP